MKNRVLSGRHLVSFSLCTKTFDLKTMQGQISNHLNRGILQHYLRGRIQELGLIHHRHIDRKRLL
jgi:hypothetical protein